MMFQVEGKKVAQGVAPVRYHPIYFKPEFHAWVKDLAASQKVSMTSFCMQAIKYAIDNMEEPIQAAAE